MTVQTLLAGAAASLPIALAAAPEAVLSLLWILFFSSCLHLLFVLGETTLPHATAHARVAAFEMTSGRHRRSFQLGGAGSAVALLAPWSPALGPAPISILAVVALAGLLAYEHAYVQAGQSVPLA